jgi:NAD(P)H-nitrite reductase large subunit
MIICPCEDVSLDDVKSAIRLGAATLDDVKRLTRSGMGWCQGLYCRSAILQHLSEQSGPRLRVPVRPTPLQHLLNMSEDN